LTGDVVFFRRVQGKEAADGVADRGTQCAGKRLPGLRRTGCAPGTEDWEIMATAWLLDLIPNTAGQS
jgi:hypothetical protein